jgi:tetratricopeptide (TPR) repeat protein
VDDSTPSYSSEKPQDQPSPIRRRVRRKRRVSSPKTSESSQKASNRRQKRKPSLDRGGGTSKRSKRSGLITTLQSKLNDSTRAARRDRRRQAKRFILILSAMIICGSMAFFPLMSSDYTWPDRSLVRDNPLVESPAGFYNAWTLTGETASFRPLAWNAFWIERRMWGSKAYGFHLTSVFLHILNAFLLWRILKRNRITFGWFAGILAAVHPGAVFSIGWVSMQPVLLATAFAQMSVLAFLNYDRKFRRDWQLAAVTLMALAVLVHPLIGMATPFCCLAATWWYRGPQARIDIRHVKRCLPMAVILVVALLLHLALYFLYAPRASLPGMAEVIAAPRILGILFIQAILPLGQNLAYAIPRTASAIGSLLVVIAMAAVIWMLWRHRDSKVGGMFFAIGWIMLAFALPFVLFPAFHVTTNAALVPDAWKYPMMLAFVPVPATLLIKAMYNHSEISRRVSGSVLAVIVLALGFSCWQQSGRLADKIGLWSQVVDQCPECWIAHQQLGWEYLRNENYEQSIQHFEKALDANNQSAPTLHGLGVAQWHNGLLTQASDSLLAALELDPDNEYARSILAKVQETLAEKSFTIPDFLNLNSTSNVDEQGYTDLLKRDFKLIREDPLFKGGTLSLAYMSIERQDWEKAGNYINEILREHPESAVAYYMQGVILYRQGRIGEATQELNRALELNPLIAGAHCLLGEIALARDETENAARHFMKALQIAPGMDEAYYKIGVIRARAGETKEAFRYFTSAIRMNARHVHALNALARILGSCKNRQLRNGRQAVMFAERAVLIDSENPVIFDTLGIAYAEAGMFSDAIDMTAKGVELALRRGWDELAENMRRRAEFYKQEKTYREDTENLLFTH